MRFVFLDDDTRMLFATAYDGDWDAYIDDFATKIPDFLDIIDSAWEGWPGIRSPEAKDYLAKLPGHSGGLVRRAIGSDGGRDAAPDAPRPGGGPVPGHDRATHDAFVDRAQAPPLHPLRRSPLTSTTSRRRCCATGPSPTTARTSCSTWRTRGRRGLLRRLTPYVDSAADWWQAGESWISVAISYAGMVALGVPEDSRQSFPEAFRVGMAARAGRGPRLRRERPETLGC